MASRDTGKTRPEGRRLQMAGGSTYMVSLPKRWVTGAGLEAGDTVFLSPAPAGALLLSPGSERRPGRRLVLKVEDVGTGGRLLRELIGAYVSGADVVEVEFSSSAVSKVRKTVRDFSRMVIGPEILEEGRTSIVVQDLSDTKELSLARGLRRMHLMAGVMHRDALHALLTGDTTLARDVVERDEDVDRLFWMVAKQFSLLVVDPVTSLRGEVDIAQSLHLRLAAKSLERIADHAVRIARNAAALRGKKPRRTVAPLLQEASEIAMGVLDRAFAALIETDLAKANDAIVASGALATVLDGITARVRNLRGGEVLRFAEIVESLSRTADYATDVAETAINYGVMRRLAP